MWYCSGMESLSPDQVRSLASLPAAYLPGPALALCPEVMTEDETVRYLRLDLIGIKNPSETLAYYRKKGLLRGTQIGKCIRYRRIEVERFLDELTKSNPR
jgi:hypothetical protein